MIEENPFATFPDCDYGTFLSYYAPQPKGACFLPDGSTRILSEAQCAAAGGVFQGNNSTGTTVTARTYAKGVWASIGTGSTVPIEVVNNKGIVGVGVSENWSDIEKSEGVYSWAELDSKIASVKASGIKNIGLAVTWSQFDTPSWLLNELKAAGQTLTMVDPGSSHGTYCQTLDIPLWWSPRWHSKRLALIAAAGAHYKNDTSIVATFASFLNHNSMDWNNLGEVGTLTGCPHGIPDQTVDQVQQWLDAGWTRARVLQVGKEIMDAVAVAFPLQNLKLPIGGLDPGLDSAGSPGVYSTLAQEAVAYVKTRPYANRLFLSRNTISTTSPTKQKLIANPPGPNSPRYIFQMILNNSPLCGLQTVSDATECVAGQACRQNGNDVCISPVQVMQDSLNVMLTYKPTFIEVFPQDARNTAFYSMIKATTIAMGGTPRP